MSGAHKLRKRKKSELVSSRLAVSRRNNMADSRQSAARVFKEVLHSHTRGYGTFQWAAIINRYVLQRKQTCMHNKLSEGSLTVVCALWIYVPGYM